MKIFKNNKKATDYWQGQIEEFVYEIDDRFLEKKNGQTHKMKDIFSKLRYI
jgi:hypothetical protein